MSEPVPVSGPYAHSPTSIGRTMGLVMLALLPATLFGFYIYGWPAINLTLITIVSALLAEVVSLRILAMPIRPFLFDGSALLSGWLLALTLPPWAPWWIGVLGGVIAIAIGKHVFGGIGQNLFNPAMVARVALLISFPLEMTTFVAPQPLFHSASPNFLQALEITFLGTTQIDAMTSATLLGHVKTELGQSGVLDQILALADSLWNLLWGYNAGSLGETSVLLLVAGGLFLIFKKVISWHIPVSMLVSLTLLAGIFHLIDSTRYLGPLYHVFAGGSLLGAFFIATDLVTSPVSVRGQLIFGAGCGALVYVIRTWAGYPEGVAFAVLFMNAMTPLIDHYFKPRIYGRDRKGEPLQYMAKDDKDRQ